MSADCRRYLSRFVGIRAETIDIMIKSGFDTMNAFLAIDMDKDWHHLPPQISNAQKILLRQALAKLPVITDDEYSDDKQEISVSDRRFFVNLNNQTDNEFENISDNNVMSFNDIDVEDSVTSIDSELELKSLALKRQPVVVISPIKLSISVSKTVDNSHPNWSEVKTTNQNNNCFKCGQCDRFFMSKTSLETHISSSCQKNCKKPFKCGECDNGFVTNESLLNHLNLIHGIQWFNCNKCQYKTSCKQNLNRHKTRHSTDRPFVCNYKNCKKSFKRRYTMRRHMKCVHLSTNRPFVCNYDNCDKAFKWNKLLLRHQKCVHLIDRPFVCNYDNCYKSYKCKKYLSQHQKLIHK